MQASVPLPSRQGNYTVLILASYAVLWFGLALYIGIAAGPAKYDADVVTTVLIIGILLYVVTTNALTRAEAVVAVLAIAALALPTGLLLLHDTRSPYLYFAYLAVHGIIAACVVYFRRDEHSLLPQWLASLQVAYIVLLLLDTLGQTFPDLLYPTADLELLTTLHHLSDFRLLLLSPIVVTWLVLSIARCKRDGSFENLLPVWRTDVALHSALIQLPVRFPMAVVSFLQVVLYRVWYDFLFAFRHHLQHLARYLATIVAVGAILLTVRGYSPWLVNYLQKPTSFWELVQPSTRASVLVPPLIGFAFFLAVPLITSFLTGMWRNETYSARLLQLAYEPAVIAAVPLTVIGPVLWIMRGWLSLPGFSKLGIVSWIAVISVGVGLLLGTRLQVFTRGASRGLPSRVAMYTHRMSPGRRTWLIGAVGAVVIALLVGSASWGLVYGVGQSRPAQLRPGETLLGQTIDEGRWRYYWVNVPAGVARWQVVMTGSADGRLYARHGAKPKRNRLACKAVNSCTYANPQPGRWWIGVYGATQSTASLLTTFTYTIAGNGGGPNVTILASREGQTLGTASDASGRYVLSDLSIGTYILTAEKYACSVHPETGFTIRLRSNVASANFTLNCPRPYTDLFNNQRVSGQRVGARDRKYYVVHVPKGVRSFEVSVTPSQGIFLYARAHEPPGDYSFASAYPCGRRSTEPSTSCSRYSVSSPAPWWIEVRGSSSGARYTITARY